MNPSTNPNDPLEQLVDAALRDLPPRRAPRTLEMRVLAEIERRTARSWWQLGYAHWPFVVRALFLSSCVAVGVFVVRLTGWLFGGVQTSSAWTEVRSEVTPAAAAVKALTETFSFIAHSIPSWWVYGALAVMTILYATLFGIGAAAYRTLYPSR